MTGHVRRYFEDTIAALREHPTDECVLWPYSLTGRGYSQLWYDLSDGRGSRRLDGHALACHLVNGPKPTPEHVAAHSCRNRPCFNPRHLRWASPAENMGDKRRDGTHREGERCYQARLTAADIPVIRRRLTSDTAVSIAADYKVGVSTIRNIKVGNSWSHIPHLETA